VYKWLESDTHLTNAQTKKKKTERLEGSAFPALGDMPINQIKSYDIGRSKVDNRQNAANAPCLMA
jgi:hypothetical protein